MPVRFQFGMPKQKNEFEKSATTSLFKLPRESGMVPLSFVWLKSSPVRLLIVDHDAGTVPLMRVLPRTEMLVTCSSLALLGASGREPMKLKPEDVTPSRRMLIVCVASLH